jgi:Zn-dependent protease
VLVDPGPSPYDIHFSLFGIHVRVSPWFWVMSAFFTWGAMRQGIVYLLVGMLCVFFSILIHEMGHVLMGRLFGADGHIVLYGFGGLAIGSNDLRRRWQRVAVSFAGPLAQFVLYYGIKYGIFPMLVARRVELNGLQVFTIATLLGINWFWPLLNLMPVWPLDGGMIAREVLSGVSSRNGLRLSLGLSVATGGFLAVNSLLPFMNQRPWIPSLTLGYFGLFLFGMLAWSSYEMLRQMGPPRSSWKDQDRSPWDEQERSWERDPDRWR